MIASAVQITPHTVQIYNERGSVIRSLYGTLLGYTSETVTIRPNGAKSLAYIYDDKGNSIRTIFTAH